MSAKVRAWIVVEGFIGGMNRVRKSHRNRNAKRCSKRKRFAAETDDWSSPEDVNEEPTVEKPVDEAEKKRKRHERWSKMVKSLDQSEIVCGTEEENSTSFRQNFNRRKLFFERDQQI